MTWRWYWGDLHSHCSISYGHGTVNQALARARQQLDFCSITGHAFWPDMPTDRSVYAEIIDYHTVGFARLARNWDKLLARQAAATEPGKFIALPSYEWHSLQYGDHNVYAAGPDLKLVDAPDLPALREQAKQQGAIVIPHHIGYAAGYRGIDWQHFRAEASPFVEIYSLHGCSESEAAPYSMLHDMGPRDAGSTAEAGWDLGHRFGVIGSTDHHSAYPGSHGDGRLGVIASALTRDAIWEALLAQRVCAATGDRIDARLFVNDAGIGATIQAPGPRPIKVQVRGTDALDRVELLKNGRVLRHWWPDGNESATVSNRHRLRLTWGRGRKHRPVRWDCQLSLSEGAITEVESCFSGPPVVAPVTQIGDAEVADDSVVDAHLGRALMVALLAEIPMADAFRVAVLGLTHDHVWNNLQELQASGRGTLVAAADPHPPLLDQVQQLHGCPVYSDLEALLEREHFDAVYVFADNATGARLAELAASRG
ncbi:MAG: Gfo/Idh/MocA family oxidoreductase [Planctomycetia bacterium]|nr:Gfo/Idh/MocA family oxidoreductase [Planctomycetia bacterium]